MTLTRLAATRNDDDGFTLVELMVYSIILTVVLGVVASMYLSLNATQQVVSTTVDASSQAQVAADSIETGVRNSSAFSLTAPSVGTQFLRARVATGTTTIVWKCAAWYYSTAGGGTIRYKVSTTAIAAPSEATAATWSKLATGVAPSTGTTIFSVSADTVTFGFNVKSGTEPVAKVVSSAVQRAGLWVSAPCF